MARKTGGEAIVEALIAHGIDTVFGLPGVQNDWLYNALHDRRNAIRVIHTRHEQGAAYMALGYTLATGKPALLSVVPGPGLLNAGAALATAYSLNARLFVLSGQIPLRLIGRETGALHETPGQMEFLRRFTKYAGRIEHPAQAAGMIAEAMRQLNSGRPRPVALEAPMDVLAQQAEVGEPPAVIAPDEPPLDTLAIAAFADALMRARSPMIFAGNGALDAAADVKALAELLQAPVVSYRTGRGILDSRYPLSLALPEARPLWNGADVIVALGSAVRNPLQEWGWGKDKTLLRIDADPVMHHRFQRADVAVTARVETALPAVLARLAEASFQRPPREAEMRAVKQDWAAKSAVLEPQISYLKVIREALGEDGIFVDELTQVGFASRIVYPVYQPRSYISCGYMGTLGYGFPAALGVKIAQPSKRVLSVTGDGGFLFAAAELAAAVQHRIASVTVLFNNNQFGNVQQMQRDLYGGRVIASDLVNPDFERFVESFGAAYFKAHSPAELAAQLERAFASGLPAVIEVPVGNMVSVDRFR